MKYAISLFSGMGGDAIGMRRAGYQVLAHAEFWDAAEAVYTKHTPGSANLAADFGGDLTKLSDEHLRIWRDELPPIEVVFGGPSCQGFSHAGKKDPNDPRNKLFWEMIRVVDTFRPQIVIMENVGGILSRPTDDGKSTVAQAVTDAFAGIGYFMNVFVLNSADYGVPQNRKRVFFVASRSGETISPPPKCGYLVPSGAIVERSMEGAIEVGRDMPFDGPVVSVEGLDPTGEPHPFLKRKVADGMLSFGKRISPNHAEIVDLARPTKTIISSYTFQPRLFVPLVQGGKRWLRLFTLRELLQLQGFPADTEMTGNWSDDVKMIGNAVPPPMVEAILNHANYILEQEQMLRGLAE